MGIKAETTFALKDQLFNASTVSELAAHLSAADASFDAEAFTQAVVEAYPHLALKARIAHTVDVLAQFLPADFATATDLLYRALPPPLDPTLDDDDFGQFIWVVPGEWMAREGNTLQRLDVALEFLMHATQRFTSEAALRPFLRAYPDQTLKVVHEWTHSKNYHVRRLASEGIRPFLPWASRAPLASEDIISVLDKLYGDSTRYVVRSVANTLNDISRTQPNLVIATLERWRGERKMDTQLEWLTRHALRTLLRNDYGAALGLLGYTIEPEFTIDQVEWTREVRVGEHFSIRADLRSASAARLKVTLKVWFLKGNGTQSAKVFAVSDAQFAEGELLTLHKRLSMRPMTTRTLYPGEHAAELVVNGVSHARWPFELIAQ